MEGHQYKLKDKCNTLCYKIKKEGGIVGRTNKGKEKQKSLKLKTTVSKKSAKCIVSRSEKKRSARNSIK